MSAAISGGVGSSWYAWRTAELGPPTEEDLRHASYAHFFAAAAVVFSAGILLPALGAIVPVLLSRSRHPFVVFHATQSLWFQLGLFATNIALGLIISAIAFVTCGIGTVLYGLGLLPVLAALIYPIVLGAKAARGEWAKYPFVGEQVYATTHQPTLG